MINESIYAQVAARVQEAYAELESHMEDPDSSPHSSHGMLELTRDRLATLAAMVASLPAGWRPAALERRVTLEPTDAWGRPRCQQIGTYVDAPEQYQCALIADHAGGCDPLPEIPNPEPAAAWQDTRDDDGRWLIGAIGCPEGCGHVLMTHRTDVGCVTCDCQHGIPGRPDLIDREKSHVLPADLADDQPPAGFLH